MIRAVVYGQARSGVRSVAGSAGGIAALAFVCRSSIEASRALFHTLATQHHRTYPAGLAREALLRICARACCAVEVLAVGAHSASGCGNRVLTGRTCVAAPPSNPLCAGRAVGVHKRRERRAVDALHLRWAVACLASKVARLADAFPVGVESAGTGIHAAGAIEDRVHARRTRRLHARVGHARGAVGASRAGAALAGVVALVADARVVRVVAVAACQHARALPEVAHLAKALANRALV